MLNYMDRQTLANLKVRITTELSLSNEHYGDLEWLFGWAFAAGSLFFGFLSDRISVRFLYPAVLLIWSSIGVLTGYCNGYASMLACRILLGFFEAGHWPCALRTTKIVLDRSKRTMGNSILQSGGAIGAILTPPVILMIVGDSTAAGAWRSPFIIIGSLGIVWAAAWGVSVRGGDLPAPARKIEGTAVAASRWLTFLVVAMVGSLTLYILRDTVRPFMPTVTSIRSYFDSHLIVTTVAACILCLAAAGASDRDFLWECLTNRRFWTLVPVVISINLTWQLIRAWLPAFLQEGRGATERAALLFNSAYYIAADAGCISAGLASLWLARKGLGVHRARLLVFGTCAAMTSLTIIAAGLPLGWGLYGVLLIVAAGSLGLFPCYYSFSQEASEQHMGKTAGLLGALAWLVSSPVQKVFGRVVDETKSFDKGLAWAGIAPFIALFALYVAWPREGAAGTVADRVKPD
jgi:ACS family hexuronate transporter-like MFS transporter